MDLGGTIEITAAYSNAVLLAILPYVSDFAARLKIDIPLPVTPNHIQVFGPWKTDIGGGFLLTNGMVFSFSNGRVNLYRTAWYAYAVQHHPFPTNQQVRINRMQAIELAREKIRALGYDLESLYTDLEPEVKEPAKVYGRVYPWYYIEWKEPQFENGTSVRAVVNADRMEIDELFLVGAAYLTPPKLSVEPKIKPDPVRREYFTEAEKADLLHFILPSIESLAQKLELPIARPVNAAQVKELKAWWYGKTMKAVLTLTNGYGFVCYGKSVSGFWAPDVFFGAQQVRVREMTGPWKLSKSKAIKLARETVRKLGCSEDILSCQGKPEVVVPRLKTIPRYSISWNGKLPAGVDFCVSVEVDAEHGRVTALSFLSNKLVPELPRRSVDPKTP